MTTTLATAQVKIVRYVSENDVVEIWDGEQFEYQRALAHLRLLFKANPSLNFDLVDVESGRFVSWAI